jgi:hypothetical protein
VLSYTNAFPAAAFPQHISSNTKTQSYFYPGAVQPLWVAASSAAFMLNILPMRLVFV